MRGSSDDSGPNGLHYGLKIIKDLDSLFLARALCCRYGWRIGPVDMDYYFKHVGLLSQIWLLTRCEFNHQWGKRTITEHSLGNDNTGTAHLHSFTGGLRENMVPEPWLQCFWSTSRSCWPLRCFCQGTAQVWNLNCWWRNLYLLLIIGKSAHGSTPEDGINGGDLLGSLAEPIWFWWC